MAVVTDARFSGVSTGACIGHVTPEALAGGPIGKLRDGDLIEIAIDRVRLDGSVNLVVNGSAEEGARELAARPLRADLAPDPALPADTRLWAALAARQRRNLGRLRLRCRSHRKPPRGRRSVRNLTGGYQGRTD